MRTKEPNDALTGLAMSVAPEDLNCGDFVATLNIVYEYPTFFWCCDSFAMAPEQPVQIQFKDSEAGVPLKIKAICLPFVFCKLPNGSSRTVDVRRTQVVRLNHEYASTVWKELKPARIK